ncbi:phosphoglucomutase/phosphomannomutase family protein [Taibaiella soli]|uniref:Phosphoglucomutase/phosphomannomutase family protein n=1 Tax=Taibaiella soli TaxID=1649169 RepID=A0A2W2BF34_9BACT|nr:phosphoglucomutase/phosphomannomutase family protein [Taibaiella soli]PZF74507.1 phosphoglucomutase/phosphomannomutase family protein [Taibaiella soli]
MTADKIKFGTDGWRAIIAQDFTVYNVARVSQALADWLLASNKEAKVVVGHDCRFGGELFTEMVTKVLCANGIKVYLAKGFISTPMISLGVLKMNAQQGVVITASHNPPSYNGYKLKGAHGGPSSPKDIAAVEALIKDEVKIPAENLAHWEEKGLLEYVNLEDMYIEYLKTKFNFDELNNSPFKLAYDAMYGAGQNVVRRLLPGAVLLHCENNPGFNGQAPEPLDRNLQELSKTIRNTPELKIGLATDGDADRIGLYDEDGNFVDAHHIILLLVHYLHKYKGMTGKVAIAFSATDRVKRMAEKYGLPVEVTPIGFKYISEIMINEDVLVGGEESGGIAVKGHIPERDGIYDGLVIYEFMTQTGKTLKQLCEEVYEVVGTFVYDRNDLHIANDKKEAIIKKALDKGYTEFGKYTFNTIETIDGVKYHLDNGGWIMLRASGTEPLLRVYAEGNSKEQTADILEDVLATIL